MSDDCRIIIPEADKPGIAASLVGQLKTAASGISSIGGRKLDEPDKSLVGTISPARKLTAAETGQEPEHRSRLVGSVQGYRIPAKDQTVGKGDPRQLDWSVDWFGLLPRKSDSAES